MKQFYSLLLVIAGILSLATESAKGQCSTTGTPSYSAGCTSQYFTSIIASGAGVTSTISYSYSGTSTTCPGSYFNYFSTQGIIAPAGGTVSVPINRHTGYAAQIDIYVDWNNNGTYETTELAGSAAYLATGVGGTTYNFVVPTTGVVTGVNLPMRIFLGEPHYAGGSDVSAPCSAWWGQSNDYYFKVVCPLTTITATAAPSSMCIGSSATLTGSGAGVGGTYTWTPSTALSATTGSSITAAPTATTTYTVTGTDVTGCTGTATTTLTINPLPVAAITPIISSLCTGGSVTLNATAGTGYTYQWYNGVSAIAGATDAAYNAAPAATSSYSVAITTPAGCSATSPAASVSVYPFPSAVVTASGSLSICAGTTVTLTATPGTGYTYQWYNGSTAITGATNISYTTGTAGSYQVLVTGPGSCNSTSAIQTVVVNPLPTATVTAATSTTFCAGDSVVFTANSGTGYTYQWGTTTGPIAGATDINYTAANAGTYSVSVTDGNGCSMVSSGSAVTVNPLPVTTITTPGFTSVCFPNSVLLSATTGAGYTYQWFEGMPAIAGATNATYAATTTGQYTVRVTNTATGCTATTSMANVIAVTIRPKPTATVTASASFTRFCSYDSVVLTGPAGGGLTYQWQNTGAPISGATNVSFTIHYTGNYKLIVFNAAGCSDTSSTPFRDTVDAAPSALVTTSGVVTFCQGGSVTLSASALAGYTYQWYSGATPGSGTAISGATNATYNTGTTAYYHAVITSAQGCVTTSNTVQVTSVPPPVITPAGPTTFCEGINVLLSVATAPGAVYQWRKDGVNISGAAAASYVATTTGYYTCFVNLPGACASFSAAVYVHVYPSPIPVITFNGSILRTYNFYTSYQWYINMVTIPGATSNTVAAYTNAGYRVLVTDTNGCSRLSDVYNIFNLAVDNVNAAAAIRIYPNPATDMVYIDMPGGMLVRLTGMDGRVIFTARDAKEINVASLPSGMYMVEVIDDEGRRVKVEKVVKE